MKKIKLFSLFMALLCAICCSLNAYAGAPDSGKRGVTPDKDDLGSGIGGGSIGVEPGGGLTYTAPTAVSGTITYDGSAHTLFNEGTTASGTTMFYKVTTTDTKPTGTFPKAGNPGDWSTSIAQQTDAGTYYLWFCIDGGNSYSDVPVNDVPITKEIQKAPSSVTAAPTAKSGSIIYNGSGKALFNAGSTSHGTMYYQITTSNSKPSKSSGSWATSISNQTNAGTYYLWYYVLGDASHYDTEVLGSVSKEIGKGTPSYTAPTGLKLVYKEGISQALITPASTEHGTIQYKIGSTGEWSYDNTNLPSATEKGEYQIYLKINGDANHIDWTPSTPTRAYIVDPAASITVGGVTTEYTDFNDALISAWVDGSTLKLLKAAEAGSWYTLNNKGDLTLDLNGFGIKSTSGQYEYATFNLSGTTNVTIIDSNPSATHKFEKGEYDYYATLNESSGNITISGGYITGAPRSAFNVGSGSTLTMNAGTLIGNHSSYTGAAVNVSGTFTMNDGAICYNYSDQSGTGVYVESDATFKLYGGSITYNLTNGGQGAGVCTASEAHFYMHGQPEVRYNQTTSSEASNVHLYYDEYNDRTKDVVIQIDDALDQSEHYRVGISSDFHSNSGTFVFTSGLDSHSGGAYDFHQFFSNDQGYYPINNNGSEAYLYYGVTYLEAPSTPAVNATITYDGSSHAMLSAPSVSNGGVVKYQYQYRKKNKSETWESWSDWSTWYTYDALPAITDAGEYKVRAKAFANDAPGYSDSGTSSNATFTINKGQAELLTAPLGKTGLVYTGSPQDLIDSNNPGTSDHGTVVYSLTGPVNYHLEIPQGTLAGTYHVYYGVEGNYNYRGNFGVNSVEVTIAPLSVSETDYDIADFFSPYIGSSISLRIERTLLKNGYFNTLCLPFDLTAEQIAACELAGCELFVFAEAEIEANEETGEPQLRQVITPATSISAGVPYLIRWKNSGPTITELVFSEVTIQNAMGDGVDPSAIPTEGVQFLGFVPRTQIEAGNHNYLFLGQNNTLYWPANDDPGTMKGFRAYFYIPTGTTINNAPVYHGMPARLVIRENAPTGVEYVSQEPMANSQKLIKDGILYIICGDRIYNAQGQIVK